MITSVKWPVVLLRNFKFGFLVFGSLFIYYYYFNIYLFLRDRDRAWAGEGQIEREGDTESETSSRLWASIQHRAGCGAQTHEPWDHDLSRSQSLSRLSHPGAPRFESFVSKSCQNKSSPSTTFSVLLGWGQLSICSLAIYWPSIMCQVLC